MTHIYDNDLIYLISLNYDYKDFIKSPSNFFPSWDHTYYATQEKYENPILDNSNIREKTRDELILIDNKVELLQDGEYIEQGKIINVPCPNGLLKKYWDKVTHTWTEGATEEEQKAEWFNRINNWKPQVLEGPFKYTHSDGKTYHQKLRVGKDDTLLSTAIQALIRNAEIPSIEWAFDDDNNSVLMSLEDLRKLQDTGFIWTQCVYEAERELKSMKADFTKDINFFKEIAIKHIGKYKIGE